VAQELPLEEGVQRHLDGPRLGEAVEELQELDPVGGQRRHAVALLDPERRDARRDPVRARVHLGEGEAGAVHVAAETVRPLGGPAPEDVAYRVSAHAGRKT
jgi:hypothetical protein